MRTEHCSATTRKIFLTKGMLGQIRSTKAGQTDRHTARMVRLAYSIMGESNMRGKQHSELSLLSAQMCSTVGSASRHAFQPA